MGEHHAENMSVGDSSAPLTTKDTVKKNKINKPCLFIKFILFISMKRNEKEKNVIDSYLNGDSVTVISNNLKLERKSIYRILKRNKITLRIKEVGSCECCFKELKNNRRKRCDTCNTAIRRIKLKKKCVEYKGNKCKTCKTKYENLSVYDFHHIEPDKKDFELTSLNIAKMSWNDIKIELDKCMLLCSNCHRIEHSMFEKYKEYLIGDEANLVEAQD